MGFKFGQIISGQCHLQAHSDAMAASGSNTKRKKARDLVKNRIKTLLVCTTKDVKVLLTPLGQGLKPLVYAHACVSRGVSMGML